MGRGLDRVLAAYLHGWARLVLRVRRPIVVAVTGSAGKTTTTETVAAALRRLATVPWAGDVWQTYAGLNNTLGVPQAVLGYRTWAPSWVQMAGRLLAIPFRAATLIAGGCPRVMVLELAAGPFGDVPRTAALVKPTIGIVTAIGPAHLEHFGSVDRVARAKAAVVREVPATGLVLLGAESSGAVALAAGARARVALVPGRGLAFAQAAARAVCRHLGATPEDADRAAEAAPVVPGRLVVCERAGLTIIDDTYNANPLSMRLALETLAARPAEGGRRIAVLGDMLELGPQADAFHREAGALAHRCANRVIGVGRLARHYHPDEHFETGTACAAAVTTFVSAGDCVLVKGSRAMSLDCVVDALAEAFPAAAPGGHTPSGTPRAPAV